MKKIFTLSILLVLLGFYYQIEASSLFLKSSNSSFSIGEEFYVDVLLDAENNSINGVSSQIFFNKNFLELKRIEDAKSMVNFWVDKPYEDNGVIKFSGIINNGFDGVIDPFNLKKKLPGVILRLVFVGKNPGSFSLETKNTLINLHDGMGTELNLDNKDLVLNIREDEKYSKLEYPQSFPEIQAEIIKDKDLYNGNYALIFNVTDSESGIKEVLVKEGYRRWRVAESPYLLKNQTPHQKIIIKASNYQGESSVFVINKLPYKTYEIIIISIIMIVLVLAVVYFLVKRIYVFKR